MILTLTAHIHISVSVIDVFLDCLQDALVANVSGDLELLQNGGHDRRCEITLLVNFVQEKKYLSVSADLKIVNDLIHRGAGLHI